MIKRTTILAALLACATVHADEVYLCKKDGKTIYTQSPIDGECQRLDLKYTEPSPEEVARQQAQRQAEEEQAREERKVRAQEAAADAAQRQARAAEAQARYQQELLRAREEEERNRIYTNPPVFFVSPALRHQHIHPIPPAQPNMDFHIGHRPDHDQRSGSAPPKADDKGMRMTLP